MTAVVPPMASTTMLHHQTSAGEIESDADEAVDRDLGHDPAHQRRDVARRGRMRERQPYVQRHDPGFRSGADQREDKRQHSHQRGGMRRAHLRECIKAVRPGQQAEAEQQRERAEARHNQVDVAGAHIVGHAMVRHHQRPRGERHEFPGDEEGEGVVGEHHERHAGEEGGIERQHALRLVFVLAITQREQAGGRSAEIDHDEEKGRQRIETEMRPEPRHAERQRQPPRLLQAEKLHRSGDEGNRRNDHARAIDEARRCGRAADHDGEHAEREENRSAGERDRQRHAVPLLSRTPRPPVSLAVLSEMSAIPSASSAATSFISESTLPRMTLSLASMRWMVGSDSPAASASVRWSMPRSAREALSWPDVIIEAKK